ncbi:hypothetical protein J2Z83_000369 [Virgibacillus natechei]|uniref:Lipoprotein n=1 Tax=Virgibacillus natechei TaxID=1216297 RepID=A0ABS4IBG7_9BACI|nr:hypothetical protein [Virgibacillus natechei]MBP1968277.1 hypothetical protein [Virgibacillus natechei]UZD14457.1 hypothetical protein OLD84_08170 [Virgibacillus natechei]
MRIIFLSIFFLILLSACNINNEPTIIKSDNPDSSNSQPELVEDEDEVQDNEEEVEEFIDFPLDDEQITVNLKMVPILSEYLNAIEDRKSVIEEMKLNRPHEKAEDIYLLEFSCQNHSCSYLLFNQAKDQEAYLLADLAKLSNVIMSPDNEKLLFKFNREKSLPLPLTNLVMIDFENWERLSLGNNTSDANILNYNWPLLKINWLDNKRIAVEKPAVIEPTSDRLEEWNQEETEERKTINMHIINN